jgi:hypothetical protein
MPPLRGWRFSGVPFYKDFRSYGATQPQRGCSIQPSFDERGGRAQVTTPFKLFML